MDSLAECALSGRALGTTAKEAMRRRIAALGLVLFLGSGWACGACTVFSYAGDGVLLFGNSEDYDRLIPHIWFLEPASTHHGVLCLGFDQRSLQGGMNDAGLCYDATGSTGHLLNWHPELPEAPWNWPTLVLQQCATVDEVEAFIRRYDYSSKGMAQFLYFDRNGDSLIVTSTHRGEIAFLKKAGGARVITNFNVTDLSVGTYPCWRYDTASTLLRRFELGMSTPSIPLFRTLLDGVHMPGYTAYSNIFDGNALKAYVYRSGNFRDVRVIDLVEALDAGPPGYQSVASFFGDDTD